MIFAGRVNAVDKRLKSQHSRKLRLLFAIGTFVFGFVLTLSSCSSGESTTSKRAAAAPDSEQVSVWFDRIADALDPCDSASRQTSVAIENFAARSDGTDHDVTLMLAAGDGAEECSSTTGAGLLLRQMADLPQTLAPLADAASRWANAMDLANRAVLLASADNLDNRLLVAEAFDAQADANAVADEFDGALAQLLSASALTPGESLQLHRWKIEIQ